MSLSAEWTARQLHACVKCMAMTTFWACVILVWSWKMCQVDICPMVRCRHKRESFRWTEFRKLTQSYCFIYLKIMSSTSGTCCDCFTASFESAGTPMKCYQKYCQAHLPRPSFTTTPLSHMRTQFTLLCILRTREADIRYMQFSCSAGSDIGGGF